MNIHCFSTIKKCDCSSRANEEFFFVFCKRGGMGWGCSYDELRGRECKVAVRFFAPLRPVPILVPPLRQEFLQSMIKKFLARGHFIQQFWYQSFALQKNPGTTVFSSFHFVKGTNSETIEFLSTV